MSPGIAEGLVLLLEVTSLFLKNRPDYDQKKREYFHDLEMRIKHEINKSGRRDLKLLLNLRDELHSFVKNFTKEISRQGQS